MCRVLFVALALDQRASLLILLILLLFVGVAGAESKSQDVGFGAKNEQLREHGRRRHTRNQHLARRSTLTPRVGCLFNDSTYLPPPSNSYYPTITII
jgi:hypothetical protein